MLAGQDGGLQGFHGAGLVGIDMIVAQSMQDAVAREVGGVVQQGLVLGLRLAIQDGYAQDDIAMKTAVWIDTVLEGEDVGGGIAAPVGLIQCPPLRLPHTA